MSIKEKIKKEIEEMKVKRCMIDNVSDE